MKPKMQFSKKQAIFGNVLIVCALVADVTLKVFGLEGVGDFGIAIVTAYGAFVNGGYFALTSTRDVSLNKYAKVIAEAKKEGVSDLTAEEIIERLTRG